MTLSPNEKRIRGSVLLVLPVALFLLRAVPPGSASRWFPFPTSCGAITGLPCIFCGTTRAVHFLLLGDFGRALYFNWLAFPLVGGALAILATLLAELSCNRNFLGRLPKFHFNRKRAGGLAAGLCALWILQVYLAVSQHKTELLNPRGPLYSLVVR